MMFLTVPYAEKDQARELGARWNPTRKRWYVPDGVAVEPFARWMAKEGEPPSSRDERSAKLVTGAHYVEIDHACNPFEPCERCAPVLAESGWRAAHEDVLKALQALARPR
jgi:hypothetical protein